MYINRTEFNENDFYREESQNLFDRLENLWKNERIYKEGNNSFDLNSSFSKRIKNKPLNHGLYGPNKRNERTRPSDYVRHTLSKRETYKYFNMSFFKGTVEDVTYDLYDILKLFITNDINLGRVESDRLLLDMRFYALFFHYTKINSQ